MTFPFILDPSALIFFICHYYHFSLAVRSRITLRNTASLSLVAAPVRAPLWERCGNVAEKESERRRDSPRPIPSIGRHFPPFSIFRTLLTTSPSPLSLLLSVARKLISRAHTTYIRNTASREFKLTWERGRDWTIAAHVSMWEDGPRHGL